VCKVHAQDAEPQAQALALALAQVQAFFLLPTRSRATGFRFTSSLSLTLLGPYRLIITRFLSLSTNHFRSTRPYPPQHHFFFPFIHSLALPTIATHNTSPTLATRDTRLSFYSQRRPYFHLIATGSRLHFRRALPTACKSHHSDFVSETASQPADLHQ